MVNEDILFLSVRELGERIRARKLSPVELAEGYLDRGERLGPKLNTYATLTRELALKQAQAAEKEIAAGHYRGPLHGVPYAVKDLVAVEGYPTTWGARPFAAHSRGCRSHRQGGDDRACRRLGILRRQRVPHRARKKSVEHELLDVRLLQRIRCDCCRRACSVGAWFRHARFDYLPVRVVRRLGNAS